MLAILGFRSISWDISRPCEKAIRTAMDNVQVLIKDLDLQVVSYKRYGKNLMKKYARLGLPSLGPPADPRGLRCPMCLLFRCNVSPDAFIQMAMQLAYYRNIGKFHATYEASMTRLYKHGRTETVRPVTRDSVAFVRSMLDPNAAAEDRLKLLQVRPPSLGAGARADREGRADSSCVVWGLAAESCCHASDELHERNDGQGPGPPPVRALHRQQGHEH